MIPRDDISWRSFGPAYDRKCSNPNVIICARIQCQRANECQHGKTQLQEGTK